MPPKSTVKRTQSKSNLVWLDLEMTGLDANQDVIIQAALIITNQNLEPLEELCLDVWQPESALSRMTPFVRAMHDKTGLLTRVRASDVELRHAEQALLEVVTGWCPYGAVLCGNSIWQDRKFIDRYMPGLGRYLGYRMVDVSSLKVLTKTWYGEGALFVKSSAGAHDALVDIHNSIKELQHYRSTIFR
jgi:oligoribonuclease